LSYRFPPEFQAIPYPFYSSITGVPGGSRPVDLKNCIFKPLIAGIISEQARGCVVYLRGTCVSTKIETQMHLERLSKNKKSIELNVCL
jgi:hypothetical protein